MASRASAGEELREMTGWDTRLTWVDLLFRSAATVEEQSPWSNVGAKRGEGATTTWGTLTTFSSSTAVLADREGKLMPLGRVEAVPWASLVRFVDGTTDGTGSLGVGGALLLLKKLSPFSEMGFKTGLLANDVVPPGLANSSLLAVDSSFSFVEGCGSCCEEMAVVYDESSAWAPWGSNSS
jgi:hypothetical protein